MDPSTPRARTRLRTALGLGLVALAAAALIVLLAPRTFRHRGGVVRIAAGLRGGTFLPLGHDLADTFNRRVPGVRAEALEAPGGTGNFAMLEHGQAELALVSNNANGGPSIRLIAPVYDETLQIVVRRSAHIVTPLDLRGKRISIGPSGSGTETIAWQVLTHFGLTAENLDARNLAYLAAADALERAEIDAIFVVAGMRTPVVDRLLLMPEMQLLSLGDTSRSGSALEGIRLDAPYLLVSMIPEHAYGDQPPQPIGTVSVHALLVARADLDEDLVRDLTEALFADKARLAARHQLLSRLSERFDTADAPYPLHPGADRYFRRDDPPLLARHAELFTLLGALAALAWATIAGARALRRRARRARIEGFLLRARQAAGVMNSGTLSGRADVARAHLNALREQVLDELLRERLDADPSLAVLMDYIDAQLREADRVRPVDLRYTT